MNAADRAITAVLVCYRRAPAALVSRREVSFVGTVRHLPPGHPVVRMTAYMAYYAQLALAGEVTYSDALAERFARAALIDHRDLARRASEPAERLALRYRVPVEQIAEARRELLGHDGR
ncbi:MAG: hypothetical protein ACRDMJ_06160 [Solirubrobacteraceae bacterium]